MRACISKYLSVLVCLCVRVINRPGNLCVYACTCMTYSTYETFTAKQKHSIFINTNWRASIQYTNWHLCKCPNLSKETLSRSVSAETCVNIH